MSELDLVTGGAGFIGSHLAEALLAAGRRVRIMDDLSTGHRENVPEGVEFVEGDVAKAAGEAVRDVETVYHLAALPSVPRSVERPLDSHRATGFSTVVLLEAAERVGARRLVLAGSSSVYGDSPELPKRETFPPRPLSPYAAAKLSAELQARSWAARSPLETVSLRFFNVYGPRQDPDSPYAGVIPRFIKSLSRGEPLPVYGDGGQTRDFTFVSDVVKGILAAGRVPGVSGRIYNLAGGRPVSVADLGRTLAELFGVDPRLKHLPPRPGDIRDSWAEVSPARRDLGWTAKTALKDGLRVTVEAFRS